VIINDLRAQSTNGFARAALKNNYAALRKIKRQARIENNILRISWYIKHNTVSSINTLARG
jgi:hypothetical protein